MNLLCQYNKQGLGQKKLFVATSHPVVLEQTSFSTASGFLPFHGPTNYLYHYEDQVKNIVNLVLGTSELDEEGFSKEIGIVGIGDYGETLVAQSVFDQSPVGIVGI